MTLDMLPKNFWNEAGHLFRRAHQINQALFAEEMEVPDLTPVQVPALRIIAERPGIDQRRLSARIGVDEATLGGVLKRLVDRRLITRITDPGDRRTRLLEATPEGHAALDLAAPCLKRLQRRLLAPFTAEEAETLKRLLRTLVSAHQDAVPGHSFGNGG